MYWARTFLHLLQKSSHANCLERRDCLGSFFEGTKLQAVQNTSVVVTTSLPSILQSPEVVPNLRSSWDPCQPYSREVDRAGNLQGSMCVWWGYPGGVRLRKPGVLTVPLVGIQKARQFPSVQQEHLQWIFPEHVLGITRRISVWNSFCKMSLFWQNEIL